MCVSSVVELKRIPVDRVLSLAGTWNTGSDFGGFQLLLSFPHDLAWPA